MSVCACAEVVPARLRTFIYAFDRSFEMAIAACAAPVVAKLAESIFGFDVRMFCLCNVSNHMPLLCQSLVRSLGMLLRSSTECFQGPLLKYLFQQAGIQAFVRPTVESRCLFYPLLSSKGEARWEKSCWCLPAGDSDHQRRHGS